MLKRRSLKMIEKYKSSCKNIIIVYYYAFIVIINVNGVKYIFQIDNY
jgi:hypothetical protein